MKREFKRLIMTTLVGLSLGIAVGFAIKDWLIGFLIGFAFWIGTSYTNKIK